MNSIITIALKELKGYFYSPLAYVIMCVFSVLSGYFFTAILFAVRDTSAFVGFMNSLSSLFLLIIPLITMKSFAEENKAGTFELILSYPLSSFHLVVGKFIGALLFTFSLLLPTFVYLSFLEMYSIPDYGLILSIYLGIILLSMCFTAIGIFTSTLTKNQVVAAISGFGTLLILWAVDFLKEYAPYSIANILKNISIRHNLDYFLQGIIDSRAVFLFLSISVLMIVMSIKIIENKRYRS